MGESGVRVDGAGLWLNVSGSGRWDCDRVERTEWIEEVEADLVGNTLEALDFDGKVLVSGAEGKGPLRIEAGLGATRSSFSMNDSHIISSEPELDRSASLVDESAS